MDLEDGFFNSFPFFSFIPTLVYSACTHALVLSTVAEPLPAVHGVGGRVARVYSPPNAWISLSLEVFRFFKISFIKVFIS